MSAIPPALPPAPPPTAPTQAAVTATPVSEVPAQIASLPAGATLLATVAMAQAQVRAVVQLITALGNLTVRLPLPVPPNAALTLMVQGSAANLQLRVIAINGQPLQPGPAPVAGEPPPPLAGPTTPAFQSGGGSSSLAGAGAVATQAPGGGPAGGGAAALGAIARDLPLPEGPVGIAATVVFGAEGGLPTGTQLILRLLDLAPALPGATGPGGPTPGWSFEPSPQLGATGLPPATPLPGGPMVPSAPGAAANPEGAPVAASGGGTASVTATPATPPGTAPANAAAPGTASAAGANATPPVATNAPNPPSLPATVPGVVAPNSLAGKPLILTPLGLVSLDSGPALQPGARVLFETVGAPVLPAGQAAGGAAQVAVPAQPGPAAGWTAFGDTIAVLQRVDPTAAQQVVLRLPDLGPQFVPNMVAWVAATQSGDIRAWLGDRAVKALERDGRVDLIQRLGGDLAAARAPVAMPQSSGDWQALTLPLFFGQRVERIRMMVRRHRDEDEAEGRDEEGLRFLVDVDMSRLGALQLDGLVKRNAKRFDLIVRSRRALPDDVQHEIGGIFARALEGMGMTGAAIFKQAVAFIEPLPVQPRAGAGLTI